MKTTLLALIRTFPPAFRERFGDELREQVSADFDDARKRGVLSLAAHVAGATWDLLSSSVAERVRPTWSAFQYQPPESDGMRAVIEQWVRDLRFAARSLGKSPGFAVVTIGTLALAIGVNAGMYSVVNAVLLAPLPFASPDRVMSVAASAPGSGFPDEFGVAPEFYVHYKENSKLAEDLAMWSGGTSTFRTDDRVERIRMGFPTNSMYSTLGVQPILGRLPVAEDEERVIVISHRLWQDWFGGDTAVIGKSYYTSGAMRTVVGIMPPGFDFPGRTLLWVSGDYRAAGITRTGDFQGQIVARVKPGVTPEQLANELTALSKQLPERFGGTANYARIIEQHRAVVRPAREAMLGAAADPLWVLLGSVGVVLLIACANVANLFIVRAEGRQRDLAVRRALGAARGRLIQAQMSEAIIVAAVSGALSIAVAAVTLPVFMSSAPENIPRLENVTLGPATLAFAGVAALIAALVCGLLPAVRSSAPSFARLRESSRGATRGRTWGRDALVVAQTALALVLLIGSGLLVRSFSALRSVDPGYSTEDIFTFQFAPDNPNLTDGPSWSRFHHEFMDRLRAMPGVETVGIVENIPLNEGTGTAQFITETNGADPNASVALRLTFSAGDYYKAMGIRLLRGRTWEPADHLTAPGSVIISQSAASLLFGSADPVGKRIRLSNDSVWATVIGVVNDVKQDGFRDVPQSVAYFPLIGATPGSWRITTPAYVVKTRRAETIAPDIRAMIREVAPNAPMYRTFTMRQLERDSLAQLSFTMLTLGIVSALALVLGAVGLYGVLSYIVSQRTREIGVRMALGAEAGQVRRMVVGQGTRVVMVGITIGVVVALLSTRALTTLLYEVQPLDPTTFVATSLSMIAVGLLASYVPARRASRVDPIESLRGD